MRQQALRVSRAALVPALLLAGIGIAAAADTNEATKAGVSAAVRGDVKLATLKQPVAHQVGSGADIFLGDHVTSGADSGMQILLLDETVFTIGPQADMVIDNFVYDPSSGTGKLAASVTKGAFRFVTGKVAANNPADMEVNTPAATIAIRGTMVAGRTDGKSTLVVLLGPGKGTDTNERIGQVNVSNKAGSVSLYGPGFGTFVAGPDQAPGQPFLVDLTELLKLDMAAGTIHPGGGGGSSVSSGATGAVSGESTAGTLTISNTITTINNITNNTNNLIHNGITPPPTPPKCVPHNGNSC